MSNDINKQLHRDIAVIGMVCRVPGADHIDEFWQMLTEGREGLRELTSQELASLQIKRTENYITAGGFINGIDLFDADFFDLTAREAAYMDPQHRLWLQACWQALEVSGHAGDQNPYIGVFASAGHNQYLQYILFNQDIIDQQQATLLGNVPDCLATRVSYTFNLTGPSMTIQCGCSSTLVAVHQARLALLAKQCDAALVGGICLSIPSYQGYTYVEGGFASPDGHCRPFSEDAAGTVFSSGYGVVVLKRLSDALKDGDQIYAIIKGSAINNDGADKASFTAPSVSGQANVIAKALRVADLEANNIQYIETHGTGTPIGDPIELMALEQAFKQSEQSLNQRYIIGSSKANLGHLDVAAGIISFIKTCLMLHYKKITPQIHFKDWNKNCINAQKYFSINKKCIDWDISQEISQDKANNVRRAGVSSFGFGGTNAHVILEEATDVIDDMQTCHVSHLIILSAKSNGRLLKWVKLLREFLKDHPHLSLPSLAYSLQVGRRQQHCRFVTKANSIIELIDILNRVSEADFSICQINNEIISIHDKNSHDIQQIWLSGGYINWKSAYLSTHIKKVILPSAPLETQSYWLEYQHQKQQTSLLIRKNDHRQWIYQSVWVEKRIPISIDWHATNFQPILIIGNKCHLLTLKLIQYFQQKNIHYYLLEHDNQYHKITSHHYLLNLYQKNDLDKFENDLIISNHFPEMVIFTIPFSQLEISFIDIHGNPIPILFHLFRQHKIVHHLKQITILVEGMSSLYCRNNQAELAMLIGYIRGIGQEFPTIKTQLLDLDPSDAEETQLRQVISSLQTNTLLDLAVWRDNKCWKQDYQLYTEVNSSSDHYFKKNGIYLITGGLGDVGSIHVEYLAKEYQATLILLGRTILPEPSQWSKLVISDSINDKLKYKLSRLKSWQESGYSVNVENVDITNLESMQLTFRKIMNRFGRIDGIIHIAGAGSDMHYKTFNELDWQHCSLLLEPKLKGIHIINQLMKEYNITHCLVISSISASLAGIGLSAYAATHNMLDAIVSKHYPHFRLMNWDAWNFYQDVLKTKEHGELGSEIDKLAIQPNEGLEVLKHVFTLSCWQQLFISTANLSDRHHHWVQRGFLNTKKNTFSTTKRPILHNAYVKPLTLTQQKLAFVWESLLGIDRVGIHDSFFELGGHSLLALELIHHLQSEFQYTCSIIDLFTSPTISQLSINIETLQLKNTDVKTHVSTRVEQQRSAYRLRSQQLIDE